MRLLIQFETPYLENRFRYENFDGFWKTFLKSDSKLTGKIISDGLGATKRLYTAILEVVLFFYKICEEADIADQLEIVAHVWSQISRIFEHFY